MCTLLLPPGVNQIAVNKYIISYHIICHIISYHITSYHITLIRIAFVWHVEIMACLFYPISEGLLYLMLNLMKVF